nr:hypothetical protein [Tanacetum cinerariifolium]
MDMTIDQQVALDEAIVPHASRLMIRKSNFGLKSDISSKESTLQLVYDVMRLTPFFKAFLVIADVPEIYMQEFWATVTVHHHSIRFNIDNKKHIVNLEYFREMLHICPRLPGQTFDELSFEEEILAFLRFLRHSGEIRRLTDVNINKLHQPWRSFAAIINKCLSGKSSGYDSLRLSQAQILWGLYHKRNVDFAYLSWEDFVYQVEHKDAKKSDEIYYPRFKKVIIHYFMSKDPSILRRNKVNWHYVKDDQMFITIKLVSRHQNTQQFGAMFPIGLTNADIRNFEAYKEYYAVATRATLPKTKATCSKLISPKLVVRVQMKETGTIPGVPDVPTEEFDEISWKSSDEGDDDDDDEGSNDQDDDDAQDDDDDQDDKNKDDDDQDKGDDDDDQEEGNDDDQDFDEEGEKFIHPSLSIHDKEETRDEESFDPIAKMPENTDDEGNDEENLGLNVGMEEGQDEEDDEDELYRDVNINLEGRVVQIADVHTTQEFKDSHVTPTLVNPDGQQQSSSMSSQFVTSMLNPTPNAGIDSIFETSSPMDVQAPTTVAPLPLSAPTLTPSTIATISIVPQAPTPLKTAPSTLVQHLPNFSSLFRFDHRLKTLEANFSEFIRRDDDADKDEEPSAGSDRGSKRRREGKEPDSASALKEKATRSAGKSKQGSKSRQTSASESATARSQCRLPMRWKSPHIQSLKQVLTINLLQNLLTKQTDSRSSFNELMDTPVDFLAFLMNRLKVDTLTLKLLAGPTYELMKGSCKILVELEFFLEEVYKATTDQLNWINPEGQQYPHNLLKPLQLISNSRGRRVIPFDHFINNDLEYLRGGALSRKYTTSVTKTKATDYGHIKWIEDLVPWTMWIQEPNVYKKHRNPKAYGRPSTWCRKLPEEAQPYKARFVPDGTLINVHTALDDRLKGILMKYLPNTIWRKSDKERAAVMIQAIDKQLKIKRIIRSLE